MLPRDENLNQEIKSSRKFKITRIVVISIFTLFLFSLCSPKLFAGITSPNTTHEFSGTLGENGWYTSTVDVTLRCSDLESGPKSTTYWLNSESPTIINYDIIQNQILNPSFEEVIRHGFWPFYWYSIRHWESSDCSSCLVLFHWSDEYYKFGWRSAFVGILFGGGEEYYYHNRDRFVSAVPGETYTASVWVKTADLWGNPGAWFEVWAKGTGDMSTDIKLGESTKIIGDNDWTLLSKEFIVPAGQNEIYLRLITSNSGLLGASWWDGVNLFGGSDFFTNFIVIENGNHNLYYYSEDNAGNIETVKETPLKIDTIGPQKWENFDVLEGGNDHSFIGFVEAQDVTSGLDVSESYFAYYTNHQDEEWDHNGDGEVDWYPASTLLIPSGSPALDGITETVQIRSTEVNFGDSATIMKFQFQAKDMAGNITNSPILTVAGAWMKTTGKGDIYATDGISFGAGPISGEYSNDGIIGVGNDLAEGITTSTDMIVENYPHEKSGTFISFFPDYDQIREQAIPLPNNRMPQTSGIYYYTGNYVLDQNSLTSGFEGAVLSTLIIIEGNLTIKKEFQIADGSQAVFLVTGNIGVDGIIENISGFFITEGEFNTNTDAKGQKTLEVRGGIISKDTMIFARDLGRKGNPNNTTTASEVFIYEPKYLFDNTLRSFLGTSQVKITWQEE